jgi:hypothetical protein
MNIYDINIKIAHYAINRTTLKGKTAAAAAAEGRETH